MPTKTITTTVCTTCGKKSCDGGLWLKIRIVEYPGDYQFKGPGTDVDLRTIPKENMSRCTLGTGRAKFLKGKKVGDEVSLDYRNWATPAKVVVRKIED